jgi:ubiquinone/menaquinone biosynthesis C-methylase UbiE
LIGSYQPGAVLACDVAEKMLQRVQDKYPIVCTYHTAIASLDLASTSLHAIFMNGVCRNIADKSAACRNASRMLRSGPEFATELPAFGAQIRHLFAPGEICDYFDHLERTKSKRKSWIKRRKS